MRIDTQKTLLRFYEQHLEKVLLPFWKKQLDHERGGVFTCISNDGKNRISTDKYTWSQGRYIWLISRLIRLKRNGLIDIDDGEWFTHLQKTVQFVQNHVFLDNGNCAFLLSQTGEKKESIAGEGFDISFFADCFVVLGFSEYSRLTGDRNLFEETLDFYNHILKRVESGMFRSEPYPIPQGFRAHSVSMILLNVSQELYEAAEVLSHSSQPSLQQNTIHFMNVIMNIFLKHEGFIFEMISRNQKEENLLLTRHINPGHSLECMWFVMHAAKKLGHKEIVNKALNVVKNTWSVGWDDQHGGIFRFVDYSGGEPKGVNRYSKYEQLVTETWDMKLWWPHSEALYVLLLSYKISQDLLFKEAYERLHEYVFTTFPNSDPNVGEWIQIRDRRGKPAEKTVALPVKDPYHIIRNVLLIVELLHDETNIQKNHEQSH